MPMLLPGIKINTSPSDLAPVKQVQMGRFNGEHWELFGELLSGAVNGRVRADRSRAPGGNGHRLVRSSSGTEGSQTHGWREADSNHRSRSARATELGCLRPVRVLRQTDASSMSLL